MFSLCRMISESRSISCYLWFSCQIVSFFRALPRQFKRSEVECILLRILIWDSCTRRPFLCEKGDSKKFNAFFKDFKLYLPVPDYASMQVLIYSEPEGKKFLQKKKIDLKYIQYNNFYWKIFEEGHLLWHWTPLISLIYLWAQ